MTRINSDNLAFRGVWVDGYLPDLAGMRKLAHQYRDLDMDDRGHPREYGFSQAGEGWTRADFFGSIAAAIRGRFDHANLAADARPVPCCMWLAQFDRKPEDPRARALYDETLADPRRSDYYHLITVHDACPVGEGCLDRVIRDLQFEPKAETAYVDLPGYTKAASEILRAYLSIMAAPWTEVERLLESVASDMRSAGP